MKTKVQKRKELRKSMRDDKKRKRVNLLQASMMTKPVGGVGPLMSVIIQKRRSEPVNRKKAIMDDNNDGGFSPLVDVEDLEIARLEKLLGIGKGADRSKVKASVAAKLNKEYATFEGLGNKFGDFLMDLDDISERVYREDHRPTGEDAEEDMEEMGGHIIDDSEQEASDIDINEDDAEFTESSDDDGPEEEEGEEDISEEGRSDDADDFGRTRGNFLGDSTYTPSAGEDIYGRIFDADASSSGVYVPPNKRRQLSAVDETSDAYKLLRRQINGLLNRLSDQSKDSITRSLKGAFDSNSSTVACHVLNSLIVGACSNPSQIMTSLIPLYAAIVSALHFCVGSEVGAYIIEKLFVSLNALLQEDASDVSRDVGPHELIGNKVPANLMLLLVYLYNLRVLHHSLIIDIMARLASGWNGSLSKISVLEVELILLIIDHCGVTIRSDDPLSLKTIIATVNERTRALADNNRIQLLAEALLDLKNNKSRRVQSAYNEVVTSLRKWLGSVKTSLGSKSGDPCLRVSLQDMLDVDRKGRWWIAGASWRSKETLGVAVVDTATKEPMVTVESEEEEFLAKLATKMRMSTGVRRSIFMVVMSSRDVGDAYERITRLDLKGKQDREVIRVLMECCAQEKSFNSFYAEVAALLCSENRQNKITAQYCLFDFFKSMDDDSLKETRIINVARFLAHLVCEFHVSIAVVKPLDVSSLTDAGTLFLSTLLLTIFSSRIVEKVFHQVVDRIATSKDFSIVREMLLFFLQHALKEIPTAIDHIENEIMSKRRKWMIKTLEAMSIIDMVREDDKPNEEY
jgi:nucleolar MIF4G domain-containing protein 1